MRSPPEAIPRRTPTLVLRRSRMWEDAWLGMEFLVRGARDFHEPGVCISFEETAEELSSNVAALGFDLNKLIARKKLAVDHVYLERSLIHEAGEYDLEALFVRLGHAVDSIGAKRVLLDSIEALVRRTRRRKRLCGQNSGVCSGGSRKESSRPSSPLNAEMAP